MTLPFPFKRIRRGANAQTVGNLALADADVPAKTYPRPVPDAVAPALEAPAPPAEMTEELTEGRPAAAPSVDRSGMGRSPWWENIRPMRPKTAGLTPDAAVETLEEHKGHLEDYRPQPQKGFKRWVGPILQGFLGGMRRGDVMGGLGGALFGGVRAAVDPRAADRDWETTEKAQTDARITQEQARASDHWKRLLAQSEVQKNVAQATELTGRADAKATAEAERRKGQHARSLVSMFNRLPEFDPNDPDNSDLVAQMREAGLPVVAKKANQQIRFVQDPKTGEWSVVAADKQTGQAAASAVTGPEGKPFVTSSAQKMLDDFRRTKHYADIKQKELDRKSREAEGAKNRSSREGIAAANRSAANDRAAAAQKGANERASAARRISLSNLALQAEKENRTLEDIVREAEKYGYEPFDDQ